MRNPDGIGKVGNIICGDVLWLYIKVGKDKKGREIIKNIRFETFGCVAAISSSSVITELAKGKTFREALRLKREAVLEKLGGLPPIKIHCSILALDALWEAIYDYLSKKQKKIPKKLLDHHQRVLQEKEIIKEKYRKFMREDRNNN